MASYTYLAREAGTGREIRSSIDAASEQAAIAALLNRNLLIVSIQEKIGKKGKTSGEKMARVQCFVVFSPSVGDDDRCRFGNGSVFTSIGGADDQQGDAGCH